MAGTDSTRSVAETVASGAAPVVVLTHPRLAENIGTAARAMLNCGLTDMRLVRPFTSHLDPRALAASSGAEEVLQRARVFDDLPAAVADLHRLYATSARRRELVKPVMTPRHAAAVLRAAVAQGERCGLLFGTERSGLDNDDIALCDAIIEAPLNPAYSSLNLAQAVLVMGYEWFQAGVAEPVATEMPYNGGRPASREELIGFFRHLEDELDACGFLRNMEKRPSMVRNIRTLFERASLTEQEIRTLHGIVKELRWGRRPDGSLPVPEAEDLDPWGRARREPRKHRS